MLLTCYPYSLHGSLTYHHIVDNIKSYVEKYNHEFDENPRIAKILDYRVDWKIVYIFSNHFDGKTLAEVADSDSIQPIPVILDWLVQVCELVEYVMNTLPPIDFEYVRLNDFEVDETGQVYLTRWDDRQLIIGLIPNSHRLMYNHYCAPEVVKGEFVESSPVFSIGTMLLKLLLKIELLLEIRFFQCEMSLRDSNPDVSENIDRIFQKAVAFEAKDRYQTIAEFKAELQNELDNLQRE